MDNLPFMSSEVSSLQSLPLALVTGAARRVGRLIALHLASRGYAIALHFHQSEVDAYATAREIEAMGVPVALLQADLTRPYEVKELFQHIDQLDNPLRFLVNSAAMMDRSDLLTMDTDSWDQILNLNTRAVWLCSREAAKRMGEGGLILNISDVGAQKNWTGYGAYVVSKSAVDTLTKVMAKQLAPAVRVCAIAPGLLLQAKGHSHNDWDQLSFKVPLQRAAQPEEFLNLIDFLIDNTYITGETINLAGGYQLV